MFVENMDGSFALNPAVAAARDAGELGPLDPVQAALLGLSDEREAGQPQAVARGGTLH